MSTPVRPRSGSNEPAQRRLRVFTFDPGVRAQLDNLTISELTLNLRWEPVTAGPVGEYVEVVDYDPASEAFYEPVDLNEPAILTDRGLDPALGGPKFHQQMVYAVAMNTIDHFERALGRVSLWASRVPRKKDGTVDKDKEEEFVPRLRIYPHALREANAYYSPKKKALLFGYFPTRGGGPGQSPGGTVFTATSYDVVAHETTHALLDGLHPSYNEPTNPDVHALHEGFADVVALFQRFAHPEVLEHQIARTRGNLEQQNMLGELAKQFGLALGMRGALRDAIGGYDKVTKRWELHKPDPRKLAAATEPHERGGIFLAAVFSAFLAIYKLRSADLFRIASNGSGILREGAIDADLMRRLAREAANAARSVLTMCIRGLDFCPPVDVDFGTYLRGVITADAEVWPQEKYAYRVAFAEAFRQWGIYPDGVQSMDESELRYPLVDDARAPAQVTGYDQQNTKDLFKRDQFQFEWDLTTDRKTVWDTMRHNAVVIQNWLTTDGMKHQLAAFGLAADAKGLKSIPLSKKGVPTIEVHAVRLSRRRGSRETLVTDLVVEVRQRRYGYFDRDKQKKADEGKLPANTKADFRFRRGCTLIIDPTKGEEKVRYAIPTRGDVTDDAQLERVRGFLTGQTGTAGNPFYGHACGVEMDDEHFAALHRRVAAAADFPPSDE